MRQEAAVQTAASWFFKEKPMKGIINGKILLEDENGRFAPQERMVLLFD